MHARHGGIDGDNLDIISLEHLPEAVVIGELWALLFYFATLIRIGVATRNGATKPALSQGHQHRSTFMQPNHANSKTFLVGQLPVRAAMPDDGLAGGEKVFQHEPNYERKIVTS